MKTYKVNKTDCFASIAKQYGFHDANLLYQASDNTTLKSKRDNLHVLNVGDSVKIPDKVIKEVNLATGSKGSYVAKAIITEFKLIVEDFSGDALADKAYTLDIENTIIDSTTSSAGLIETKIEARATRGRLTIWLNSEKSHSISWPLVLGGLAPFDENSGVQARLNNLGYHCGAIDNKVGKKTKAAIKLFKSLNGLNADDVLDMTTKNKLKSVYGF